MHSKDHEEHIDYRLHNNYHETTSPLFLLTNIECIIIS